MPIISRRWVGGSLAAAGLILAAASGGVVLSASSPTRDVDWAVGQTPEVTSSAVLPDSGPPLYVVAPPTGDSAEPSISVLPASKELPPTTGDESDPSEPSPAAMPAIPPSPAVHLWIPAIAVDAQVIPVDSTPTGAKNAWGGEVFEPINFPVDRDVRQWIRRGDPNSVPAAEAADDVKAFDRTVLYGHASDIGHHLIFQDLSALTVGDSVTVDTAIGRFVYAVTGVVTRAKTDLDDLAALYQYPTDGRKELALVACLPDSTRNVVAFATLVSAEVLAG